MTLAALAVAAAPAAAEPALVVDTGRQGAQTSRAVNGVDQAFSRTDGEPPTSWLPATSLPNPAVVSQARVAGVSLVRFPGGKEGARYDVKAGLGAGRARCQFSGVPGSARPMSNVYGFDEHQRFVEAVGAETSVMVPYAFETASDAADWVEYANSPDDGSNPNGGTDWAAVRAANGHPEPYGVRRWEIGNEPDRKGQRYWMSADKREARRQYARGGVHVGRDEPADAGCAWAAKSTGLAYQTFLTRYAPVRPAGFRVVVRGERWRRVPDLQALREDRRVYTLNEQTGVITFGDGAHGRVPPLGARVYVFYETRRLPGYDAFRTAMKQVDPDIEVCASWADARFLRQARAERRRIDCLAVHPYTLLGRFGGILFNAAHHDAAIKGADAAAQRVRRLGKKLARLRGRPLLAITEYGALGGSARLEPGSAGSMIHALYMATEQLAWLRQGVGWATGGRLTDSVFELVRGLGDRLTPAGELRRVLGPVPGRRLVRVAVRDNPRTHGYPALRAVAAVREDGGVSLLVLNRSRDEDVTVQLEGVTPGPARITQATAASYTAPDVTFEDRSADIGATLALPKHSFTRVDFAGS